MEIQNASQADAEQWDRFVIANSPSSFLQSWAWGEVLRLDGRSIQRLMAYKGDQLLGLGLAASYTAPFNLNYGYAPYGPIAAQGLKAEKKVQVIEAILKSTAAGFMPRPAFIRVDPEQAGIYIGRPVPQSAPLGSAVFASAALAILDINQSEERIRAAMKQKTRYNLRRSQKFGVAVVAGASQKDFETFWQLLAATQARAQLGLHPKAHYQAIMNAFGKDALIITASHKSQALAALLVIFFGNRAVYVHGGSLRDYQTVMAPYAAHWFAIQEAKRRGCATYDFGGASEGAHGAWAGFTRFKLGFGARVIAYDSRRDFVINPIARRAFYTLRAIRSKLKP